MPGHLRYLATIAFKLFFSSLLHQFRQYNTIMLCNEILYQYNLGTMKYNNKTKISRYMRLSEVIDISE